MQVAITLASRSCVRRLSCWYPTVQQLQVNPHEYVKRVSIVLGCKVLACVSRCYRVVAGVSVGRRSLPCIVSVVYRASLRVCVLCFTVAVLPGN